jgi:hypothetical protein
MRLFPNPREEEMFADAGRCSMQKELFTHVSAKASI